MKEISSKLKEKCGVYIITNLVNGKRYIDERYYFKSTKKAADFMKCSSQHTLKKHANNTKENPYIIPNTNFKMYMSSEYIPYEK